MPIEHVWVHETNGAISAMPVILDAGSKPLVAVGTSDGRVVAVDGTGTERWQSRVVGAPGTMSVLGSGDESTLVVGDSAGWLTAIGADGSERWRTRICELVRPQPWNSGLTNANGIAEIGGAGPATMIASDRAGALTWLDDDGAIVRQVHLTSEEHFRCAGRPAVADVDDDGSDEIVVSGFDGRAFCLSSDGGLRWTRDILPAEGGYHSPCIADWGDGPRVVLLGTRDGVLCCLDGAGREVWEFAGKGAVGVHAGIAPIVVNGDPRLIVTYNKSGIELVSVAGESVWYREFQNGNQGFGPTVADIDGDGSLELLHTRTDNHFLWVMGSDGTLREEIDLGSPMIGAPIVADIDGDGIPELLTFDAATGQIAACRASGAKPGGEIQWQSSRGAFDGRGSAVIADGPGAPTGRPVADVEQACAVERSSPAAFITGRQPVSYSAGGASDGATIETTICGPDGMEHRYPRRPGDRVHGWVETIDSGPHSLTAVVRDRDGIEIGRAAERIDFEAFAPERARGEELLAGLRDLLQGDATGLPPNFERSVRAVEDRWAGIVSRLDAGDAEGRDVAESAADHLALADRILACGRRASGSKADGPTEMLLWQPEHPWVPFNRRRDVPPGNVLDTMRVSTEGGSHEATVVAIANLSDETLGVRVWLDTWTGGDDPPGVDAVDLREVISVATARMQMAPDALPPLGDAGIVSIAPHETARVWLDWSARDTPPGSYESTLHFRALTVPGQVSNVELEWDILPVSLPKTMPIWFHVWAYTSPLVGDEDAVWQDLLDHHVNVFGLSPPRAVYDSYGEVAEVDWSAVDRVIDRAPDGSFFLWHGGEGFVTPAEGVAGPHSEPWLRACEQFAATWVEHLAGRGVGYDRHANYIVDEPGIQGGKIVDYFERMA